jgi:hypothetical protein
MNIVGCSAEEKCLQIAAAGVKFKSDIHGKKESEETLFWK